MALKDLTDYMDSIDVQYGRLVKVLNDLEKQSTTTMVDYDDAIAKAKAVIAPFQSTYEVVQYMRYLLNEPKRDSKKPKYKKAHKKTYDACTSRHIENVTKTCDKIKDDLKTIM